MLWDLPAPRVVQVLFHLVTFLEQNDVISMNTIREVTQLPENLVRDAIDATLRADPSINWVLPFDALHFADESEKETFLIEITNRIPASAEEFRSNGFFSVITPYWEHPLDAWRHFGSDVEILVQYAKDVLHYSRFTNRFTAKYPIFSDSRIGFTIKDPSLKEKSGFSIFRIGHYMPELRVAENETVWDIIYNPHHMKRGVSTGLQLGHEITQAAHLRYLVHFPDAMFLNYTRLSDWAAALALVADLFGQDARWLLLQGFLNAYVHANVTYNIKEAYAMMLGKYKVQTCTVLFERLLTAAPHDFSVWEQGPQIRLTDLWMKNHSNHPAHMMPVDLEKIFFETFAPLNLLSDWCHLPSVPAWIREYLDSVLKKRHAEFGASSEEGSII